ncbi:hypothetical protein PACTADRAFT_77826 [Pachysolen tannophilus NRRL Y-2460]|uniref:Interferon-related developmental regulator N-terminal domain-containing protein n=1 Tax=Pachysolen tannophilus NRRL Y-2460 TaxID=669874 RepID=A0A1E4TP24_PACTA|nr:hypothetical protein PACTADRAFT_77826 [Pachysolen tannophilus NRRL Y-2460]
MSSLERRVFSPRASSTSRMSSRSNSRGPSSRGPSSDISSDFDSDDEFNFEEFNDMLSFYKQDQLSDVGIGIGSGSSDEAEKISKIGKEKDSKNPLTNSISEILTSLDLPRTTVSTSSREALLAQLFHLIISKPLKALDVQYVTEFNTEQLINFYNNSRSLNESLLALRTLTTFVCSDIDEVSSLILSELIPSLKRQISLVDEIEPNLRSNLILSFSSLLMCIIDGSGAYGMDEHIEFLFELIEGLLISENYQEETDVFVSALYAIGLLLTLIYNNGENNTTALNELIEDNLPRLVDNNFLENPNINISKATGKLIALMYELYDYHDYEIEDEEDEDYNNTYSPYYDASKIIVVLKSLSTISSKKLSKKTKKESHSIFRDILKTVESYSESKESRLELTKDPIVLTHSKLSKSRSISVKSWYSYFRLFHLRWLFGAHLHDQLNCNSELSNLIRPPQKNKFDKFSVDADYQETEEVENEGYADNGAKRKIKDKKKTIQINNSRMEKFRREFGDVNVRDE